MASAYLSRTPSSNGNRKTWTFSAWCKVQKDSNETIFDVGTNGGNNYTPFFFQNDQTIRLYEVVGGTLQSYNLITNRKFRDRNAWYHLVYRVDTTQSTASDRIRLYVNGVQETSFSTAAYPAQNYDTLKNSTSYANVIGVAADNYGANFYDGLMAHVHFCDGYSYAPTEFGETDSTTGIWKPKTAPSVTYGTNGFFLKFENSAAMGTDSAGSNNFTVNGPMTKLIDTPTNVFATLNPLVPTTTFSGNFSNGNTTATAKSNAKGVTLSTLGASTGKYYFEAKITNTDSFAVGITNDAIGLNTWSPSTGNYVFYKEDGNIIRPSGSTASGTTYGTNDIIGVAWNATNSEVTFYKNGNAIASAYAVEGTQGTMMFAIADSGTGSVNTVNCNFGNGYFGTTAVASIENPDDGIGIFEFDVPAGYRALCTKSINAEEYS